MSHRRSKFERERALNNRASRQRALLSADDIAASGLSYGQLRYRLARQQYRRLRRKVVAVAGAPPSWEQAVQAVSLSAGRGVFAAGYTAARLLGGQMPEAEEIEVLGPRERRVRLPGVRSHRTSHLFDEDVTTRHGIPCTSAARTLVDLSSRLDDRALGKLADDFQRRGVLKLTALDRCAGRLPPAPGRSLPRVHRVLAARWPGYKPGESDLETRVLRLLVGAGLPVPRQQHRIKLDRRRRYFDLAWPDIKLAVEVDGQAVHGTASQRHEDRLKGNEATQLGWWLVRVDDAMTDAQILAQVLPVYQRLTAD